MIAPCRARKTSSRPAMGLKMARKNAVLDAARRRRQRVLTPLKRDQFLELATRSRKFVRCVPSVERTTLSQHQPQMFLRMRGDKSKYSAEYGQDAKSTMPAGDGLRVRPVHPPLVDVVGGPAFNVIIARRLPEQLQRPELEDLVPEELAESGHDVEVVLKGLEDVRRELVQQGLYLFNAIASTIPEPMVASSSSELPEFVTISAPRNTRPEHMPTHMLMVHSGEKDDELHRVLALPVHEPVLAAHCSRVPPLPSPAPASIWEDPYHEDAYAQKRTVPVVPFQIPSPDTFPLVMQFLCMQDPMQFLKSLVPVTAPECEHTKLAEHLAASFTGASLVSHAMRVYGVWQNACSLGVLNPRIWQVIDVAWKGYRDALLLARR